MFMMANQYTWTFLNTKKMRVLMIIYVDASRTNRNMSADVSRIKKEKKKLFPELCKDGSVCLHMHELLRSLCCISNRHKLQRNHQLRAGQPLIWLFTCEFDVIKKTLLLIAFWLRDRFLLIVLLQSWSN